MPSVTHKKPAGPAYIDILPMLQPVGIILGLVAIYLALTKHVDIYTAVLRGVFVYAALVFVGVLFHYVYILMLKRVKILEARRIAEIIREAQENVRKESEQQAAASAPPPPSRPAQR